MNQRRKQTMDGNTAAAYASYAFTDVSVIYPITPSSTMAEIVDVWAAQGKKNIFGQPVIVKEMQSEGGAAGTLHGCLQGGALATTYTASQGLLLMIPNMYKIAGELLPSVFHVSARSLASNALSIFGDHQDVMSTRQTGFSIIASSSVQEALELGAIAHLAAIKSRIPVLHFFDGFRTSHEMQKIEVLEYEELAKLVDMDAVNEFRGRSLNPNRPVLRGTTQNPDIFFQTREAVNKFYEPIPEIFQYYMDEINKLTGRDYKLFNYYGSPVAENIIIAMGSGCDVIRETIEYFNAKGANYGLLEVHLYRPFSAERMLNAIPKTVKRISVLDRTKEPGAAAEPLYLDVRNAFFGRENAPLIVGGRYGLGSKDFTPLNVMEVFTNLEQDKPRDGFTVGIVDDVTHLSLPPYGKKFNPTPAGTIACKFWGFGSDGTVGANKSAVKIIGDHTDMHVQAYFAYDSKKSGGVTISHLRFGNFPIRAPYLVSTADFISCSNQSYVHQYDLLEGIKEGGTFLLNCIWNQEELEKELPAALKRKIAEEKVEFYTINAVQIAKDLGLGSRINMIMQSAFFKLSKVISLDDAIKYLKESVEKSYGKRGQNIVDMNWKAIDAGISYINKIKVPDSWKNAVHEKVGAKSDLPEFVEKIMNPVNGQKGDYLPVSVFNGAEDGTYPTGTTKYEKRGIAIDVPHWDAQKCIQCNACSFVCPHSVIRPTLLKDEQMEDAPKGLATKDANEFKGKKFHLAISILDCTGCGICVDVCPTKEKSLVMKPLAEKREELVNAWEFAKNIEPTEISKEQIKTVKGSQFLQPLFEFSGACAGCGETPYAKLITQLFGDRMVLSNSAGCSTVWGGSAPSVPYTKNSKGHGPAWGFSLFEDNAEYGFGMYLGAQTVRKSVADKVRIALSKGVDSELEEAMNEWLEGFEKSEGTRERADKLTKALEQYTNVSELAEIYERNDYFIKQSNWIFGGDGWAYDIGYGGLDHVLASGEDINVIVFDTEVYSNTGGQSSKSTPTAAIAKFAAAGKETKKKDLGMMAISYGYVYVAQIAMGADRAQTLKTILEAEAYPGPSLIIAYAPCVNHGIKAGMGKTQDQAKRAVESGYWSLYRYNPLLKKEGKNPFTLDSKEPRGSFEEFLLSEVRYSSLLKQYPYTAKKLFKKAEQDARERLESYKRLSQQ
ncbi:pyruvate:ferredoxin (flavodoxin) oxidoreductase [Clostridium bovifaecis]|uniref:Pyruvate:ferredoxin oxidoreductase n=1 Tax=Clostridium bovifaecis TaxID=2184719 RepID=A0A6I6F6G0_9CLOT|nr:pyruvate:ferredoxin (flavodoxin) oxidoreductase [Clostridium bovifaecis]